MPLVWAKTFPNGIVLLQKLQAVIDLGGAERELEEAPAGLLKIVNGRALI
jgi:hypothetical protein